MRQWLRSHLTYANVMVTIAVFLVLSGGTAVALQGSNTVFTDDIANDTQPAGGGNPKGGLAAVDLRPNSVGSSEVANNTVTGIDVNESTLQGVNAASVDGAEVCDGVVELSTSPSTPVVTEEVCMAGPLSLEAICDAASPSTETLAFLRLHNTADHSFYAKSNATQDADWNATEAATDVVVAPAGAASGGIARQAFSAGATDGSQPAGEVAARPRHLGDGTGTCHFALGIIG